MPLAVTASPVALKLPYVRWFTDSWTTGLSSWYAKPPTYDGTRWLVTDINNDDIYASTTIDGTFSAVANWSGTFTPFTVGNAQEERFIRYENNRYFFMDSRSGTANAGKVWSTNTYNTVTVEQTGLGTNQGVSDCIWVGGTVNRFIAVGINGQVWTAPDTFSFNVGTWTLQTTPVTTQLRELAFDGTTIVAVGATGTMIYSTNGTSWTNITSSSSFGSNNINSIVWTGSHFVAIGSAGTLGYSSTGTSGWTQRTLFSDVTTIVLTLLSHRGGFLFVGNKGAGTPDAGTGSQPESYRSTTTDPAGAWVQVSSGTGGTSPFVIRNARKGTSNGFYAAYGYSPGANVTASTAYSV